MNALLSLVLIKLQNNLLWLTLILTISLMMKKRLVDLIKDNIKKTGSSVKDMEMILITKQASKFAKAALKPCMKLIFSQEFILKKLL